MRFITISAAVLLGSALTAANAQELRAANTPPSTKYIELEKGLSGPGGNSISGGSETCGTATAIAGVGVFPGDTVGAVTDGPAGCSANQDVWYSWTAGSTGNHTFSFCAAGGGSATYDSFLAAYDGVCGGTQLACNDDFCGLQSQISFAATNGNVYKIRVGGFGGATGSYNLSITTAGGPPANDACATPTVITGCGGPPFAFNNGGATTGAQGQTNANCLFFGQQGITNDLWYTWTAPSTGSFIIATCGQTTVDTKIAIYNGAGCPGAAAIVCNDDACALQTSVTLAATGGNLYTIQLGTFPGAAGGAGTFTIDCPAGPAGPCDVEDDGTTEDSVGTNNPAHDILWMHAQGDAATTTVVKSISTAWGSTGASVGPPNGGPARVGIWSDPNGDGNPTDAVLIQQVATVVAGTGTDALQTVNLSPSVLVTGAYFIGASCTGGTFPAPLDTQSGAGLARVWILGSTVGAIDYTNLAGEEIPPTDEDTVLPGHWLLRGDCKSISMDEVCGVVNAGDCPCGNDGLVGNGCANSANAAGAHLSGSGNSIVSADSVSISASGIRGGNPTLALFFSGGETPVNPVNDGLLCAGNPVCRLWIWKNPGQQGTVVTLTGPDASTIPPTTSIAQRASDLGRPIQNGDTVVYTVWYRDPANFACASPSTSNYTNGLRVLWSQ